MPKTNNKKMNFGGDACRAIKEALAEIGDRTVTAVVPINVESCMETHPCQGHDGAYLMLEEGSRIEVRCSSVAIGALMKYFTPAHVSPHFASYVEGFDVKAMV